MSSVPYLADIKNLQEIYEIACAIKRRKYDDGDLISSGTMAPR